MKKSDVVDITIRAQAGKAGVAADGGADVMAPASAGPNMGGAKQSPEICIDYDSTVIPSGAGGADDQPDMGKAKSADSVQTSPAGKGVSFPDAADRTSAGGAKSCDTFAQITGSKVGFPAASDTSMQPKMTDSFANK